MSFFIPALLFCLTVPISFILLVIIYIQFALAVKSKKEVPNWIYMFGQSFKRRTTTKYDDITNYTAFKQANSFILLLILSNIVFVITEYIKSKNLLQAVYNDIQSQFMVVIVSMILHGILTSIIMFFRKSDETFKIYSPTQAVIGGFFYFAFFLTLSVSLVGLPEKPINIQIENTNIVIGKTKASYLLDQGFNFKDKNPDDIITKKDEDYFYYGKVVELMRDDKSYGFMHINPIHNSDKLKDCIITFYNITPNSEQFSKIRFNNIQLSSLTISDFKTKPLKDVFNLKPANYKESKNPNSFILRIQPERYMLWTSYRIEANFTSDMKPYKYSVGAQHVIWE